MIICTVVVYKQVQVAKDRPVGYTRDGLVMIKKRSADFKGKYDMLRAELKSTGVVAEMSESYGEITQIASGNGGFNWGGKDPNLEAEFGTLPISFEFGKTVGWQFTSGRDFSRDLATDSMGLVINQAAAKVMGLKTPIGEDVSWNFRENPTKYYKIIGVVKDMVMRSPYEAAHPTLFMIKGHVAPNIINIKLAANTSMSAALSKIESVFDKVVPAVPLEYKFADEEYATKFAAEEHIGKLAAVFAVLAIFISCLGLSGLASFVAEQRVKEIGIRKVLGASVLNLWALLSKDFVQLVLIAQVIASPIAYYFMNKWLQQYNYRAELSWWVFALTFAGAMFITVLTVSYQGIKAALENPVRSLRSQ